MGTAVKKTSGDDNRLRVSFTPAQARALRKLADKAPPSARRTIRPRD